MCAAGQGSAFQCVHGKKLSRDWGTPLTYVHAAQNWLHCTSCAADRLPVNVLTGAPSNDRHQDPMGGQNATTRLGRRHAGTRSCHKAKDFLLLPGEREKIVWKIHCPRGSFFTQTSQLNSEEILIACCQPVGPVWSLRGDHTFANKAPRLLNPLFICTIFGIVFSVNCIPVKWQPLCIVWNSFCKLCFMNKGIIIKVSLTFVPWACSLGKNTNNFLLLIIVYCCVYSVYRFERYN